MGYLIVFVGGGIGAALRHGFNLAFARLLGTAFPYATLFENISSSVVMGCLVAYFAFKSGIPQHWHFLATGTCVLLSFALSIGGPFAGLALVRNFA